MNDLVRRVVARAVKRFGDRGDGLFNAAGFGVELARASGVSGTVDGHIIRAILTGRPDIQPEPDGSHYRRV